MLIHELTLRGLLSFGPDTPPLTMQSLNVLIGPNGSGKSNLVESIGLLRSAATKLAAPMRGPGGGGVAEWIWKGDPAGHACLDVVMDNPKGTQHLRHTIEFCANASQFELVDEKIENESPYGELPEAYFYYKFQGGRPVMSTRDSDNKRQLQREDVAIDESILSQRRDPDQFPEMAHLARAYEGFRLYREWSFGRSSVFRAPQAADLPSDSLEENFSNLGLFLNHLRGVPKTKNEIITRMQDLYEGLADFVASVREADRTPVEFVREDGP